MTNLTGTIALVTGGARGIGEGIVRRLVADGAKVAFGDVNTEAGEALAAELGNDAKFIELDVTHASSWSTAVAATKEAFGPVTLLVNNAGVVATAPLDTIPEADIRRIYDVNLLGPFLGFQAVVPDMKQAKHGIIVNVASASGLIGMPMQAAYSSSKWGLRGLAKSAAIELGQHRIRVNTIHPGAVRTAMAAGLDDAFFEDYAVPRIGEPADIAGAVAYLASEDASFITGVDLAVDGGFVMGPRPSWM